jgi:hypothetical protein
MSVARGDFTAASPTGLGADPTSPVQASLRGRYAIFPESVVLDDVHVSLTWRDQPNVRYPMRLRALLPVLAWAPPAFDTTDWYPTPTANARPTTLARLVQAGGHVELDSLRLVVVTRRSSVHAWRAIAIELEAEEASGCGANASDPCLRREYLLAILRLSAQGAQPSN